MTYISLFPSITALGMEGNDLVPIVDTSLGVTPAANKRISYAQFFLGVPRGTGVGFGGAALDRIISPAVGQIAVQVGASTVATFTADGIASNWNGEPIPVNKGGTGGVTAIQARTNLGLRVNDNDLGQLAASNNFGLLIRRPLPAGYGVVTLEGTSGQTSVVEEAESIQIGLSPTGIDAGVYGNSATSISVEFDEFGRAINVEEFPIDTFPSGGSVGQSLVISATSPSLELAWTDLLPTGGAANQFLSINSASPSRELIWKNINEVPVSGATGQLLTKTTDGYAWADLDTSGISQVPLDGSIGKILTWIGSSYGWVNATGEGGVFQPTFERKRHEYVPPYSYCGSAPEGTSEAAADWRIVRLTVTNSGEISETKTAQDVAWTNRTTVSYT